jgi:hypothetical protein
LVKKIIIVKNATVYTWDWYCHLVVGRASFRLIVININLQTRKDMSGLLWLKEATLFA